MHVSAAQRRGGPAMLGISPISMYYAKVLARDVILTKWVDATFLSRTGLAIDFKMMVNRSGLWAFSKLR
jgi:hypothetical protein